MHFRRYPIILQRIPISAPLVTLLPLRRVDALEPPALPVRWRSPRAGGRLLVVHALNDLVALATVAPRVLTAEHDEEQDGREKPDPDVHEHDAVPEGVPWPVARAVLVHKDVAISETL